MSTTGSIAEFAPSFSGQLLQPQDAGYDEARRVTTALSTSIRHSSRAAGASRTSRCGKASRKLNLEVAVRGGGHNVAGRATIETA